MNKGERKPLIAIAAGVWLVALVMALIYFSGPGIGVVGQGDGIVSLGVTHFSGMEISGDETDELVVNQTSSGDIVEFRDGGSVVARIADGGASTWTGVINADAGIDFNGFADAVILDADGDTTISSDVEDTIEFEINSANDFKMTANLFTAYSGSTVTTNAINETTAGSGVAIEEVTFNDAAGADSAATNEHTEVAFTTPIDTTGINTHNALTIDLAIGASTGGTNHVRGLEIDGVSGDPQVIESAIVVGAGWDYAFDTTLPIVSTAQTYYDDFMGNTIRDEWALDSGSTASDPALDQQQFGVIAFTTNADSAYADDFSAITLGLHWSADQGSLVFETRLRHVTNITAQAVCFGLTDVQADEQWAAIDGSDVVTIAANDGVAFCFDDTATSKQWFALGVDGTTPSTGNGAVGAGSAPVAGTFQIFRIEVDAAGEDARFYIDGALVATLTANVVNVGVLLTPFLNIDNLGDPVDVIDMDYIYISAARS
ncbi:hypothetical protein LCGC14_0705670 [marine sediment metagenome]|uniref:Uncharacterized protein n=1 Tax=marine sediment metagenome TaxID=412755 RepID=A0A0F9T2G4_9ZZZZ|nr:hypothetical protein [bacterium]